MEIGICCACWALLVAGASSATTATPTTTARCRIEIPSLNAEFLQPSVGWPDGTCPPFVADVARVSPVSGFRINRARCIARPPAGAAMSGCGAPYRRAAPERALPHRHSPDSARRATYGLPGRHEQRGETPPESLAALSHRGKRDRARPPA